MSIKNILNLDDNKYNKIIVSWAKKDDFVDFYDFRISFDVFDV